MNPITWEFKADSTDSDTRSGVATFTVGEIDIEIHLASFGQGVSIFNHLERAYRLGAEDRTKTLKRVIDRELGTL